MSDENGNIQIPQVKVNAASDLEEVVTDNLKRHRTVRNNMTTVRNSMTTLQDLVNDVLDIVLVKVALLGVTYQWPDELNWKDKAVVVIRHFSVVSASWSETFRSGWFKKVLKRHMKWSLRQLNACEVTSIDTHYDEVKGVAKRRNFIYILCDVLKKSSSILVYNCLTRRKHVCMLENVKTSNDMALLIDGEVYLLVSSEDGDIWMVKMDHSSERYRHDPVSLEPKVWLSGITQPYSLSVTRERKVLVLRRGDPSCLEVYESTGEAANKTHSIQLPEHVGMPRHAVETSRKTYVILHVNSEVEIDSASEDRGDFAISEFGQDGQVLRSFSGHCEWQRLINPWRLAVDSDDRVFVVDSVTDKVMMFESPFRRCRIVVPKAKSKIRMPWRLFLCEESGELLLAYLNGVDFVICRQRNQHTV